MNGILVQSGTAKGAGMTKLMIRRKRAGMECFIRVKFGKRMLIGHYDVSHIYAACVVIGIRTEEMKRK